MNNIDLHIEEGNTLFHYKTKEIIKKCPSCGRAYKSRKCCLDCFKKKHEKIETIITLKEHEGWITKDLKKYSCDCVFASFHGQSKHWLELRPKSICKHVKWMLKKIKDDYPSKNDGKILPRLK